MDETKQDDKENRRETRPVRIHNDEQGEIADIICAAGHAYQVVYSQEPTWMFYLRLTTIDGEHLGILRVVFGARSFVHISGSGDGRWDFFPGGE